MLKGGKTFLKEKKVIATGNSQINSQQKNRDILRQ